MGAASLVGRTSGKSARDSSALSVVILHHLSRETRGIYRDAEDISDVSICR
jgi:hypothetical protein